MDEKSVRYSKLGEITTKRSGKKSTSQTSTTENGPPLRRSPRLNEKAKPSQAVVAAKKNAKMRQVSKKVPDVVIKDIYQTAREAKDMVRKQTGIIYDRRMTEHKCIWDPNYPECPERFTRVLERCEALGLISRCLFLEAREATENEILMQHSVEQVKILKATSECRDEEFLEDLSSRYDAIYFHPRTYKLSLLSAGSAIELTDAVCMGKVQNGMAVVRPPGHHAMKSEYCGYCFFNNVALAATHALTHCGVSRILIVDWDVHHGQATQQMFYSDPRVVYFSLHRFEHGSFWPNLRESDFHYVGKGPGLGYNFNIPLNNVGMTDADYLAVFHQVLLPMASEFQPELILVSAGYDAAIGCPEFGPELVLVSAGYDSALGDEKGEMEVTPACYAHLLNSLLCLAGGKVAVILEGGYCLQSLAEGAALTLRALLGDPCPLLPSQGRPCEGIRDAILNVIYTHQDFWQCYQFQDKYSLRTIGNLSNKKFPGQEEHHMPVVKFLGSGDKPERFATRNCYPVQSHEFVNAVTARLDHLIANTKLTFAPHRVCLVYDERMMKHKNTADPSHPEKPERISAIFSRHEEYGLLKRCHMLKARSVSQEELLLLHTQEHINLMQETACMRLQELAKKQDDFRSVYLHPGSYQAACLAAGSVLQVVDSVLNGESRSGVAIVRPPGHHAEEDEPCGFCMFNNVSLAAKYAIQVHGLKRILLLDWDVHHGNGSQHMFESDPRVLYLSIHRYDNGSFFPGSKDANYSVVGTGKGEGYNVNIPWNKSGMSDAEYLTAFHQVVLPISYQFSPELVLVSSGFDACIGDPLGGCKVSPEAYGHLTHLLTALAGGRVILSLEGGYNVTSISHAMPMCTKALLGDPLPSLAPPLVPCPSAVTSIKNVIRTQARYWSAVCFQVALPQERVVHTEPLEDKVKKVLNVSDGHQGENDEGALITLPHKEKTERDIKVPPSAEQNFEAYLCHTLNASLSKLSLDEGQVDPICSDRNTSPMGPSSDPSPVSSSIDIESQMWPKSSSSNFNELSPVDVPFDETKESSVFTLPHTCSISFSDEGYRSEEQYDVTTFHEGTVVPLTVITEHDRMSAADSDGKSSNGRIGEGQQGQSGSTSEDTNGTSSQIPDQQTLVNYLSENMQMLLGGEMFAVVPLRNCPHLVQVQPVPECGIDCNSSCAECGSVQENWVCLVCYTVHCGRYISEHMMLHGHSMSHPLTLSFSDLSVWCYACEAYIDNQILYAAKNALHRKKFGEDMPWSYGDADPRFPV